MDAYSDLFLSLPKEQQEALLAMPFPPPKGMTVVPVLDDPPNNNALAHGLLATTIVISTAAILLRAYARGFIMKKFKIQDAFALVSFGCFIACVYFMYRHMHGIGFWVRNWNLRIRAAKELFFVLHFSTNLYSGAMMCIKAAILIEWISIFSPNGQRNKFWWFCSATLVLNTLFYISVILAENLSCTPYPKIWDRLAVKGRCRISGTKLMVAGSAVDVLSNIVILVLPQVSIWRLRLPLRKRIGVSIVFAMGIFATAGVARRTAVSIKAVNSADFSYLASEIYMWAVIEMMFGFIVFCTPTFPLAFKNLGLVAAASKVRSWGSSKLVSFRRNKSSAQLTDLPEWPLPNTLDSWDRKQGQPIAMEKRHTRPKYDKYGQPLTDMSGATQVDSIADVTETTYEIPQHETTPPSPHNASQIAIVRTMEVETRFTSRQEDRHANEVPAVGRPHHAHYRWDHDGNYV